MLDKPEEELWDEYKKNKSEKIREAFIIQYAPLVKYVAGKVALGMPKNIEFEDLVGYGIFGLLDAIEKFDPKRDIKFKTYAVTRIRGAIYDELRSIDWVPRSIRQKAKELDVIVGSLENKLGRNAKDDEIAKELGVNVEDYYQILLKISTTTLVSINEGWGAKKNENDRMLIVETIEGPKSLNPDAIVEKEEIKNLVIQILQELPEKEKKVLILYYYEDLTLKEIGEILNVTESRVSQLHTKAICRLRSRLFHIKAGLKV